MNIEIRNYIKEDINNGLLDVYIEGYKYHQNGRPDIFQVCTDETLKEDFLKDLDNVPTLVAIVDNKVVGYLSYKIKEKHTKKLDVEQLIVTEEFRGHGIGKKLMKAVEEIASNEKCDRIELNCWMFNDNALNMYRHIGFTEQRIIFEKKLK